MPASGTPQSPARQPKLDLNTYGPGKQFLIGVFVVVPFLALLACIPLAAAFGLFHWHSLPLLAAFYAITTAGIGVGFHRHFTHSSFKAKRWLQAVLGVCGSLAIEGPLLTWVADHRRHHLFSDQDGDPHSPWRYGTSGWALTKGMLYAHVGWLFRKHSSRIDAYARNLQHDPLANGLSQWFPGFVAASLLLPALAGGVLSWSLWGALSGLLWGGLVRICLMHHVTWSINSICHTLGERPFKNTGGDRSSNVWWLAIPSFGEAWHSWHHIDMTSARHGVLPGQVDINARLIALFEWFGWAHDVRWPNPDDVRKKQTA